MPSVDVDVVLVAEHRHGDLGAGLPRCAALGRLGLAAASDGPAPVAVDLPGARLGPARGRAALAQRRLLVLVQPRLARLDDGRIDDLATHGKIAPRGEDGIEAREQPGQRASPRQLLAEQPDRLGVGHGPVQRQTDEAHEAQPVAQLAGTQPGRRTACRAPAARGCGTSAPRRRAVGCRGCGRPAAAPPRAPRGTPRNPPPHVAAPADHPPPTASAAGRPCRRSPPVPTSQPPHIRPQREANQIRPRRGKGFSRCPRADAKPIGRGRRVLPF